MAGIASNAIGAEAQLSANNYHFLQQDIVRFHNSQPLLEPSNLDGSAEDYLTDKSMTDIVGEIATAISEAQLLPDGIVPSTSGTSTSWESLFTNSRDYYLIDQTEPDAVGFVKMTRSVLSLFADLDALALKAENGYTAHNILGTEYMIWPHSDGGHALGLVLQWPLQADITFHNGIERYDGAMQLSTNDHLASAILTQGTSKIRLSFATPDFITEPLFVSTARLEINDANYDTDVLIAQIFDDAHDITPLWGRFVTIAPDDLAPHYGTFKSQ